MAAASKSPSISANNSLGVDDFPVAADAHFENSKNGDPGKKPAWKKPSNGAAASVPVEVGAVMGADSWPALSDSASRASPKPSLLPLNGPVVESEEMPPVSPPPQKEPTSMQGASTEAQRHNAGSSGGSARDHNKEDTHRAPPWQRGRPFGDNEQHSQNGPLRSNNGPRGDGFQHHRHGARRDNHRRENFASQRRDGPRHFVGGPIPPNGPFAPPPMVLSSLFNPVFYSEFPSVYYVPAPPHLDTHRMVSYSPMFMPPSDPNLYTKILSQIEYYFSNENLVKDIFLRGKMDSEGWVSIHVIAGFAKTYLNVADNSGAQKLMCIRIIGASNRRYAHIGDVIVAVIKEAVPNMPLEKSEVVRAVKHLTSSPDLILDVIQASNVVEVQGDKIRRKGDWNRWLMPRDQYFAATSHSVHGSDQK